MHDDKLNWHVSPLNWTGLVQGQGATPTLIKDQMEYNLQYSLEVLGMLEFNLED